MRFHWGSLTSWNVRLSTYGNTSYTSTWPIVTVDQGFANRSRPTCCRATLRVRASKPWSGAMGALSNVPARAAAVAIRMKPRVITMGRRTCSSSLRPLQRLETEIESRLEDVRRIVVAIEVTLVVHGDVPVPEVLRLGGEDAEVEIERDAEQVRG